jgi:hypothetical protein
MEEVAAPAKRIHLIYAQRNVEKAVMGKTTCIRKADWVIAWDLANERHVYLSNADVAFEDGTIIFVGKVYP